jgi:hypothetical protein
MAKARMTKHSLPAAAGMTNANATEHRPAWIIQAFANRPQ